MGLALGEKVDRVVQLLMGLRNRRAAAALAAHGFGQSELDAGWAFVRAAVGEKLSVAPFLPIDLDALDRLDVWENRWFPIARAALDARHPAIAEEVFLNLSQTEGSEVIISVGTFVRRIETLETGDAAHVGARELLRARGLSAEVIADAAAHLEKLAQVEAPPAPDLEAIRQAQQAAEDAMWGWYLEWSSIARVAIRDGRLLQLLGFGRGRRRAAAAELAEETAPEPPDAPPASPASPAGGDGV